MFCPANFNIKIGPGDEGRSFLAETIPYINEGTLGSHIRTSVRIHLEIVQTVNFRSKHRRLLSNDIHCLYEPDILHLDSTKFYEQ